MSRYCTDIGADITNIGSDIGKNDTISCLGDTISENAISGHTLIHARAGMCRAATVAVTAPHIRVQPRRHAQALCRACTGPLAICRGHCPTRIFRRQVVTLSKPTYQVLPPWSAGVWSSRKPRPGMLNKYIITNVMCDIVPDVVSDIVPDIASDVVVYLW